MKNTYKIIWSDEALNNLKRIITYLEHKWTEKEIKKFASLLDRNIKLIQENPFLFAISNKSKGLRRSVITKQTTLYYNIVNNEIHFISLFDNRQNLDKLNYLQTK